MQLPPDESETADSGKQTGAIPPLPIVRLGSYRLECSIGSGGMGTVYRAYDDDMRRHVALKVMQAGSLSGVGPEQRFAREAWIAGQLSHPNVIGVYSRGEDAGYHYLAMELADQGTLADVIADGRRKLESNQANSITSHTAYIREMVAKIIQIADAIEHVHSKGFIHRDIKPHNILLSGPERTPKLTDFGIAHSDDLTKITHAGDFMGTIKYMSPELIAAHRSAVDKRSDIYSLGVTLYELLTLSLPYNGDTEQQYIGEILSGRSIPARRRNPNIPRDLETIILKAISHDPLRRYQSATGLAQDLARFLESRPIQARRETIFARTLKFVRRHAASFVTVLVTISTISILSWLYLQHDAKSRDYREIVRTLRSAIETGKSAESLTPNWAQLAPQLADLIRTSPLDSAVLLYYRSRCLLGDFSFEMQSERNNFHLLITGARLALPEPEVTDPLQLVASDIKVGIDSLPSSRELCYLAQYVHETADGGFVAVIEMDSLITGLSGSHFLNVRVVSRHYRNAKPYESIQRVRRDSDDPTINQDASIVITNAGQDTLIPILKSDLGQSLHSGDVSYMTILDQSTHLAAEPLFVDTLNKTFNIFIPDRK